MPVSGSFTFLSVYADSDLNGYIEVRNWNRDVCLVSRFRLHKEGDAIELDVTPFPTGKYEAYLKIGSMEWRRQFQVLKDASAALTVEKSLVTA